MAILTGAATHYWGLLYAIVPAVFLIYFLSEHLYRIHRFGRSVTVSPVRTIRAMLRPDAWVAGS